MITHSLINLNVPDIIPEDEKEHQDSSMEESAFIDKN